MPPSDSHFRAGARIDGRYALVSMLGEGAFGSVWKAEDERLNRRLVAVKVLKSEFLSQPGAVARFDAEADAMAQLTHPNVVAVHDRGEWQGHRFLVMEYVEGRGLAGWLAEHRRKGDPPTLGVALALFDQLCAGLEAAHEVRSPGPIVHRDLKPDNVLLKKMSGGELQVKVVDFGIAQLGRRSGTQSGVLMGTPLYMAPEQATGWAAGVGPWTDVFALGVILTEMLTLHAQPSEDEPWWGTAMRRPHTLRGKLASLREDVPGVVFDLVAQCMGSEPDDRFRDAHALRIALRDVAATVLGGASLSSPSWPVAAIDPPAAVSIASGPHDTEENIPRSPSPRTPAEVRAEALGQAPTLLGEDDDEVASVGPRTDVDEGEDDAPPPKPVPWLALTAGVVVVSCALAAGLVFAMVTWDQRPRRAHASSRGASASDAGSSAVTATTLRPGPLSGNAELQAWLRRWDDAAHGARRGSMAEWYAPAVRFHGGDAVAPAEVERRIAQARNAGGTLQFNWARSEWSAERESDSDVPDTCRRIDGARGDVWKVRAWAVEVRPDRHPAIGCPRLEGRYLIRVRRGASGLRVCHESWSMSEGICASCPTASVCTR